MSNLIEHHEHNDSDYYTGPLPPALDLIESEGWSVVTFTDEPIVRAEIRTEPDDPGSTMTFGAGRSENEALRYALGAEFGPLDEMYDEPALRKALGLACPTTEQED